MAYLLRSLLFLMLAGIGLTALTALGKIELSMSHIQIAIPAFIYVIFIQAFVMFYFIGVSRLITNIWNVLHSEGSLEELFDEVPKDIGPYIKKVRKYVFDSTLAKRQTIPWTMLMLVLGTLGFLLGGAHDTGLVRKIIHSGVIYGFIASMIIGFFKQWSYLGKSHRLLREVKGLFSISDNSM